jgi:hypothetical protein
MSEIDVLRRALIKAEAAISVQQTLFRTFAILIIEREISSSPKASLRDLIDQWHALIDAERTTSKTPDPLQEEDREFARQHVDLLARFVEVRQASGGAKRRKDRG